MNCEINGYYWRSWFESNIVFCLTLSLFRPRGKESTEVRKSQIKGKESENSYQELKRSRKGQAHTNPWKLNRDILTGTAVFLNRKRVNVCEHPTKTASLESLRKVPPGGCDRDGSILLATPWFGTFLSTWSKV